MNDKDFDSGTVAKRVIEKTTEVFSRPVDPPIGTRFNDGVKVVEWDGANWREPASGRIA